MISVICQHCTARFDVQSLPAAETTPVSQLKCPLCGEPAVARLSAEPQAPRAAVPGPTQAPAPTDAIAQATWPPPPLTPPLSPRSDVRVYPEVPLPEELLVERSSSQTRPRAPASQAKSSFFRRLLRPMLTVVALAAMALWRPPLVSLSSRVIAKALHATFPNPRREDRVCQIGALAAEQVMAQRERLRLHFVALGLWDSRSQPVAHAAALPSSKEPESRDPKKEAASEPPQGLSASAQAPQSEPVHPKADALADAQKLLASGDVLGATHAFQELVSTAPSGDTLLGLAGCQLRSADYQAARASAKRGLELNFDQANLYYALAEAERGRGDLRAMNHALRQYLVRDPRGAHSLEARRLLSLTER